MTLVDRENNILKIIFLDCQNNYVRRSSTTMLRKILTF